MSGTAVRIIRVAIVLLLVAGLGGAIIGQVSPSESISGHPVATVISTEYTSSESGDVSGPQTPADLNTDSYSINFTGIFSANSNLLPAFQNYIKTSLTQSLLCSRLC